MTHYPNTQFHFHLEVRSFTFKAPIFKRAEFAHSVDPIKVGHDEPPHWDPHCFSP